jgi:type II secretion system protein H
MVVRRAFTLLELILVLAIAGIVASVVAARVGSLRPARIADDAARTIADLADRARHEASARGAPTRLRVALDDRRAQVAWRDPVGAWRSIDDAAADWSSSVDDLRLDFQRDDAQPVERTVDALFLPDRRCDAPGSFTIAIAARSLTVRLSAMPLPSVVQAAP